MLTIPVIGAAVVNEKNEVLGYVRAIYYDGMETKVIFDTEEDAADDDPDDGERVVRPFVPKEVEEDVA